MSSRGAGRARRGLAFATLFLVVSVGVALVEDAFFHTDDGCVVETHCLACRWHYGAVVVATHVTTVAPALLPAVAPAIRLENCAPLDGAPPTAPSRGPPLA